MTAINIFQNVPVSKLVEDLVTARAKKAEADKQVKAIETILKEQGVGAYESHYHTVKVTGVESHPVNWKALAADLKPSEYFIKKHTGDHYTLRLTVSAKKKEVA